MKQCHETVLWNWALELHFGSVFQKYASELCFETLLWKCASNVCFETVIRVLIFQRRLETELQILREKYMYRACIAPRYLMLIRLAAHDVLKIYFGLLL